MATYGVLLALMLVMRFAPASPIGKALNRQLVELPLRALGGMRRHHLIFLILMAALVAAGTEAMLVAVSVGGMDFAVLWALDVSLYMDGLLMTLALASMARTSAAVTLLGARAKVLTARMRRSLGTRRARRTPIRRAARRPSNDDDHPAFALAA